MSNLWLFLRGVKEKKVRTYNKWYKELYWWIQEHWEQIFIFMLGFLVALSYYIFNKGGDY